MKTLLMFYSVLAFSQAIGATVFLVAEGIIDQASGGAYPFVDAGDSFRLTVSYSDHFSDTDPDPDLGVYLLTDLRISLEILGEGIAFESIGGSVNVQSRAADFPVYSIFSRVQPNGHSLLLFFSDLDQSHAPSSGDGIPVDFGQFDDYDAVGFAIFDFPDSSVPIPPPIPGAIPINPVEGTVTSMSVPEPATTILAMAEAALALVALRRRPNQ